jgi:hypothetical protein
MAERLTRRVAVPPEARAYERLPLDKDFFFSEALVNCHPGRQGITCCHGF